MNIILKHKDLIKQTGWMLVFMQCTALCIALMRGDSLWVTPLYLFEAAYYHWTLTFILSITTVGLIALSVGLSMQKGANHFYGLFLMLVLACVGISLSISLWLLAQYLEFSRIPVIWHIPWLYQALAQAGFLTAFYQFVLGGLLLGFVFSVVLVLPWEAIIANVQPLGHAHFATVAECLGRKLFLKEGIVLATFCGQPLRIGGFESVLWVGPMGSGKTSALAITNLIEWSGSMITNDFKGELFEKTSQYRRRVLQQEVIWLDFSNKHQGENALYLGRYNPFYYVSDDPNYRIRDIQRIAEIIIPSEKNEARFWCQSSRELFMMLALYLFESKGIATLAEIHDVSKKNDFFEWIALEVKKGSIKNVVFKQCASSLLQADAERTQKNILTDFHSRLGLFSDPLIRQATSSNSFDLRKLRKEKMSIYLHIPESDKERLRPLLTLFWSDAIHLMTEAEPDLKKEPYPVLALLDEFGNMAKIPKLKDGMSFLRSYRVRVILTVQYLSQIQSIYGHHDAQGFLNTRVKMVSALTDYNDAAFFSKLLGDRAVKVRSKNISRGLHDSVSHQVSTQHKPLMTPSQLMQLKKDDLLIIQESFVPIRAKKRYWFKVRDYKERLNFANQKSRLMAALTLASVKLSLIIKIFKK